MLLSIVWAAVEYPEECLLVEVLDLGLNGLNVSHIVTVRKPEPAAANSRSRRRIVEERIYLIRDGSVLVSTWMAITEPQETYSGEFKSPRPSVFGSMPTTVAW